MCSHQPHVFFGASAYPRQKSTSSAFAMFNDSQSLEKDCSSRQSLAGVVRPLGASKAKVSVTRREAGHARYQLPNWASAVHFPEIPVYHHHLSYPHCPTTTAHFPSLLTHAAKLSFITSPSRSLACDRAGYEQASLIVKAFG